jgi:Holliday junction resolvase
MAINSRDKGNRAERFVAQLFKNWTGKDFARTPSSGGLSWKSSNSKGDIVCTTEGHYFPFCLEIKHHNKVDFNEILVPSKKSPKILQFWAQCTRDAGLAKKAPILFFRYNNLPKDFFFVVIDRSVYSLILKEQASTGFNEDMFLVKSQGHSLVILTSTHFFKLNYREIKPIIRKAFK